MVTGYEENFYRDISAIRKTLNDQTQAFQEISKTLKLLSLCIYESSKPKAKIP